VRTVPQTGPLVSAALHALTVVPEPMFLLDVVERHDPIAFRCSFVNPAYRELLGIPDDVDAADCFGPAPLALASSYLERALFEGADVDYDDRLTLPGHVLATSLVPLVDRRHECSQILGVVRDVTERHELRAQVEFHRHHDPLTGLPNRVRLRDRLAEAITHAGDFGATVALLLVDLDRFNVVCDSLGHEAGDELLVAIAERIERVLRFGDVLARVGGDEFAIVCGDVTEPDEALTVATRVLGVFDEPLAVGDAELLLQASIGVAIAEGVDDTSDRLLRDADAALVAAKQAGRGRIALFDDDMRSRAVARLDLEKDLHRALARRELRVHYQPLVHFDGAEVIGFEALLRWEHPQRGLMLPAQFVPLAEETGLIVPMGAWVLDEVCAQVARWNSLAEPGDPPLQVSVNLSARQLTHPDLVATVAEAIGRAGIEPSTLVLEITETVLMDDPETASTILHALRSLGVKLAIDDFGTGHSSLGYLKALPVNCLKIDRAFVSGLSVDPDDEAIVAAVVRMGHALGLEVTAEGIETLAQLEALEALGCDVGQGFYFARPQPGEVVSALVRHRLRWHKHAAAS
jgi:diguanylate cyclase (GGDEF)-like protein